MRDCMFFMWISMRGGVRAFKTMKKKPDKNASLSGPGGCLHQAMTIRITVPSGPFRYSEPAWHAAVLYGDTHARVFQAAIRTSNR